MKAVALELKSGYGDAFAGRGAAWLKKNDYARALTVLSRAIEIGGARITHYATRASVYEAQGKLDLAIDDLRKAAELKPKSVFDTLAQAAARQRADELAKRAPCGVAAGRNVNCL
jgi:tetratricopeptide (TPR) repeat protein